MANIKIPQLGSAQTINDTNYLIVDDGLSTMKATAKQIKEYATNDVKAEIAENWTENVNYTVGNFVNWNGEVYRCIQNNLSSESLTPANVTYWEKTKVSEEIENLNEAMEREEIPVTFESGWMLTNSNRISAYRVGKRCVITFMAQKTPTAQIEPGNYIIATIPARFAPIYTTVSAALADNGGSPVDSLVIVEMGSNCNIALNVLGSRIVRFRFTLVYDMP